MQSTFWKAVALTGVISVGCLVVYEVHRRMPRQPGETRTSGEFQELGQNGSDSGAGDGSSIEPPDGSLPPAQDEPENGLNSGFDGVATSDRTSAAPWEQIPQRTDQQTAARAGNFLDVVNPSATSGADGATARQLPDDTHTAWTDDNRADVHGATARPLTGPEGFDAATNNNAGRAGDDPEPVFGAAGVVEREPPRRTRDIRPVGATEAVADSATADPFTGGVPLEPADASSGATSNGSDPTGLFDSPLGGPALDGHEPADSGAAVSPLNGLAEEDPFRRGASGSEPDPLPNLDAAPLADAPPLHAAEGNGAFDPFNNNGVPSSPAEGTAEQPAFDATGGQAGTGNAESEGSGLPAPREFVPFDTAEPARADSDGQSGPARGLVLPSDAPAEFPVGAAEPQPAVPPASENAAPFTTITPARVRQPDRATTPAPAAVPARDFAGDGIISAQAPSGPQQPELKIEKVAPPEATIGDPLVYAIRVTNVGRSAAHDVIVEDRIPRGTTLDGTIPRAEMTDKKLLWRLGTIEPGGEQMIRIRVIPTEAGEIGSVATVRFVAEVAAATVITRPELSLEMSAPGEVAVGEQATFHFKVTNSGAADARDVIIRNLLPRGLEHPDGNDIEYPLGRLRAGESREIELTVLAKEAGQLRSQGLVAVGTRTYAEREAPVLVIPSRLLIRREGPARRFVGRKADYTTTVTNRSSRDLQQVTVEEQLQPGLELASMPKDAQFDARRRTITWKLPLIRAGESIPLKTSVVAESPGTLECVVRASDAAGNKAALASKLEVAGFSALAVDFEHAGRPGPVAVGEQVSFRLTVKNRGTAAAEGVQAQFEIPEHMEFVHADGPVAYTQEGQVVRFATLDEIPAKDETSFNIVLTAAEAGTKKVTAELSTTTLSEPLRNDQAVVVEADE